LNDDNHETIFLDCTRARKNYYFCGEKGRYYERINKELEISDDYDFETYIQLL